MGGEEGGEGGSTGLGDGEAGEFHELVDGEGAGGHEFLVEACGVGGGEGLWMLSGDGGQREWRDGL